jgi:hypothetical protein
MRGSNTLSRSTRVLTLGGLTAIAFALTVSPTVAIDAAAPTTAPAAAKPAQSPYKPYFVEFRSRSAASYGHMYVFYGQVNGRGEIIKSDIAGLHPAGDANDCDNCSLASWMLGHVLFVPAETGASDGDLEEKYVTARYRVMVDAATFKNVSAYISKKKADKPMWHALINSCVTFANEIAEHIGLKTPSVLLEPMDYVERLRDLNGGKPQKALRFSTPASALAAPPKPILPAAPSKPNKEPATSKTSQAIGAVSGATR